MMHQSIATISSPEFINLQPLDINPLMSNSYISEDVAKDMAKTLRGAPIVGYYKEDKEDFADHGEQVILDDEGVKFNCLTKPYGFVAPDAKVWFQDFEDTDDFGNKITRKYLMTTGYLWTGQYEEAKRVIEKGNNQSMELDESSLDGHWSTNVNNGMDFFIINDAIFSKLCILGEDVEPCFEGASITAPQVSNSFSKVDDSFKQTLYTMMQDLKYALEGGKNMEEEVKTTEAVEEEVENTETEAVEAEETESSIETETTSTEAEVETETESEEKEEEEETTESEEENSEEEESETEEEAEGDAPSDYSENEEETSENEEEESEDKEPLDNSDDVETKKKEYSLEEYEELKAKYDELVEFKKNVEMEKKQNLIDSFYMLSDEDKKDVKEHMSEYSLEEIESKLCVICVKNKVNFEKENLDENNNKVEEENSAVATFNIDNNEGSEIPAWISACINTQNSKN